MLTCALIVLYLLLRRYLPRYCIVLLPAGAIRWPPPPDRLIFLARSCGW